jgi:Rrf2 family iron-sulfur cluster assembly transcriptional regulator
MLVLLPQTAEYALRAVLEIAAYDRPVRVAEIAATSGIPRNYLGKTLYQLARAGILTSTRGRGGGFRLGVPAEEITLERIVSIFAAPEARRCLLGNGICGENTCALHDRWAPIASQLGDLFDTTSIADLLSVPSRIRGS